MKNQLGMTFIGTVFVGAFVVGAAILVMKLIPPYLEFFSVKKVISVMAKDTGLSNMSPTEIKASFDRHAVIDNIKVINGSDLEISKDGGETNVTANYDVTVPLFGNLSAFIHFETSTGGAIVAKPVE
jgi:hypothetical protein